MKQLVLVSVFAALGGCSACGSDNAAIDAPRPDGDTGPDNRAFGECDGDAPSFVRQAFLALDGRRPKSQAETDAYADMYRSAAELGLDAPAIVARAIMNKPEFAERWVDVVMDAMQVQRLDIQTEASCWDDGLRGTTTPALALAVRGKPALQSADGMSFTMIDLARSAIAADDLTPIYRGQIFSLVSHPIPAANVPAVQAELARRADIGATFDASFLHRDTVCLGCHNSESSVTDSDDPVIDRHWPVPGIAEKAVYGMSNGVAIERAHAVFRIRNFVDQGTTRPWGWSAACGSFAAPAGIPDDPAAIDAKLASVTGSKPTVFDLDGALQRGFAALRTSGAPTGAIADPDTALAWLVTLKITEDIWKQATGTQLTISNYYPRNQASSEMLYGLAQKFVAGGFSLKALLVAILSSDYFNRIPADAKCGPNAYSYPNVFDPWVISDSDAEKRLNGPGDAVTAVDARTLVSAAAGALEWTAPPLATRFPDYGEPGCDTASCSQMQQFCNQFGSCCTAHQAACVMNGMIPSEEVPFQRAVGVFLRNSERGFRGLDFQARLSWEDRYGTCSKPRWVPLDFIDRLVQAGNADPAATARDAVAALKDRLVGEPAIAEGAETTAVTQIVGDLAGPASGVTAVALRRVCGALLGSPQFLLQGIAGRGGDRPLLTPANAGYDATCAGVATGFSTANPGLTLVCTPGSPLAIATARTTEAPAPAAVPAVTPGLRTRRGIADPRRMPAPTGRM